jgi:hypothetical protein
VQDGGETEKVLPFQVGIKEQVSQLRKHLQRLQNFGERDMGSELLTLTAL